MREILAQGIWRISLVRPTCLRQLSDPRQSTTIHKTVHKTVHKQLARAIAKETWPSRPTALAILPIKTNIPGPTGSTRPSPLGAMPLSRLNYLRAPGRLQLPKGTRSVCSLVQPSPGGLLYARDQQKSPNDKFNVASTRAPQP